MFLIGRIIAGGFFLTSGINHFAKLSMTAGQFLMHMAQKAARG
jgi:hypothetical protein